MLEIKRLCAVLVATLLVGFGGLAQAETQPLPTVKSLDLQRFLGKWPEIALIPNRFQRKCVRDTEAEYAAGESAELVVRNRCVTADGAVEVAIGVARGTALSSTDQNAIDGLLRAVGYDPQRLVKTPQSGRTR